MSHLPRYIHLSRKPPQVDVKQNSPWVGVFIIWMNLWFKQEGRDLGGSGEFSLVLLLPLHQNLFLFDNFILLKSNYFLVHISLPGLRLTKTVAALHWKWLI